MTGAPMNKKNIFRLKNNGMKKIFLTIMAATAIMAGCQKTPVSAVKTGTLEFSMSSSDGSYNDREEGMLDSKSSASGSGVSTKAYDKEAALAAMLVTISNKSGVGEPLQWVYSEMPGVLELTEGQYTISAVSPDSRIAAWDQPVFGGSKEFSIIAGRTSTVELVCGITNVKVSVNCTEEFLKEFSEYSITVRSSEATEDDGFLIWGASEVSEGKEGYFTAADLTVTVQAYRWSDATQQKDPVQARLNVTGVEARDHIILNIDAKATGAVETGSGDGKPFITIDDSMNERDEDILIGGLDEIPVPGGDGGQGGEEPDPEPELPAKPTLEWAANPDFAPMEIKAGMDVNLVVNVPGRIATFVVGVQSSVLEPVVGTSMDLIYDESFIENFGSLLPTGDALLGQTRVDFSLSALVPLIGGLGAAPESEHVFTLNVSDEYGQSLSKALTFVIPAE